MTWPVSALTRIVAGTMLIGATTAQAAEITVIASPAVKEAVFELIPAFEKASGHKVTTIWDGTEAITKRIGGGEVVDIVLIAAPNIDQLIAAGKVVAGSRADIAKSGIGVAVRAGLPKPDISSGEAVKNAVLAAKSVAYSSGPSGLYLADLFKKMGIADEERIYRTEDLASGNDIRFVATGVTDGEVLKGVHFFARGARTHSILLDRLMGKLRFIDTTHFEDIEQPPLIRLE